MGATERHATNRRLELHPLTRTQVRRLVPICHETNMLVHVAQVSQLALFRVGRRCIHIDTAKRRRHPESASAWDATRLRHELSQLALRQVDDLTQGAPRPLGWSGDTLILPPPADTGWNISMPVQIKPVAL